MPETGESALILFTIIILTSLLLVFGLSFCGGGNFMGVLHISKTLLHFLQAVGFSQTLVILPLFRRFRNVVKSDY